MLHLNLSAEGDVSGTASGNDGGSDDYSENSFP